MQPKVKEKPIPSPLTRVIVGALLVNGEIDTGELLELAEQMGVAGSALPRAMCDLISARQARALPGRKGTGKLIAGTALALIPRAFRISAITAYHAARLQVVCHA
ncbi:hypothetical protein J7443_17480 [Tropicibacter sp. R15_0]|uniref:hypothetical protein n=1 Tax=Tropicibacter sp. R15_0 TaxID=2821101 RepID=UPI001ADB7AA5|nr:hypothetical protein [Tropicibacter sp. R15_0]MBO9467039.1 hypothetical protein [Tropicibacter sp. R15_0]